MSRLPAMMVRMRNCWMFRAIQCAASPPLGAALPPLGSTVPCPSLTRLDPATAPPFASLPIAARLRSGNCRAIAGRFVAAPAHCLAFAFDEGPCHAVVSPVASVTHPSMVVPCLAQAFLHLAMAVLSLAAGWLRSALPLQDDSLLSIAKPLPCCLSLAGALPLRAKPLQDSDLPYRARALVRCALPLHGIAVHCRCRSWPFSAVAGPCHWVTVSELCSAFAERAVTSSIPGRRYRQPNERTCPCRCSATGQGRAAPRTTATPAGGRRTGPTFRPCP